MSAIHHTYVRCDFCTITFGEQHKHFSNLIKDIRAMAKEKGWVYYGRHDEMPRDYCPDCRPKKPVKPPKIKSVRVGNNGNGFKKGHPNYNPKPFVKHERQRRH